MSCTLTFDGMCDANVWAISYVHRICVMCLCDAGVISHEILIAESHVHRICVT